MLKVLYFLMIVPILFCSQGDLLPDLFQDASSVILYKDGEVVELSKEDKEKFDELFEIALDGSIQMPAFAVSIDNLTKEEMKTGYWVKFIFDQTIFINEMPFDELLIHIQQDSYGINVIRGNNGVYDGRCFYLNLENSLNDLYTFISEVESATETSLEVEMENQETEQTNNIISSKTKSKDNEKEDDDNNNLKKTETNGSEKLTDIKGKEKTENIDENKIKDKSQKKILEMLN